MAVVFMLDIQIFERLLLADNSQPSDLARLKNWGQTTIILQSFDLHTEVNKLYL